MSKYEELCQAYGAARQAYSEYRDACFSVAHAISQGLVEYLGIPAELIRFVPVNHDPDVEAMYSLASAMHLEEDAFWHWGVNLSLNDPSGANPPQSVLLKLMVKRHEGVFEARLGQDEEGFTIRPDNPHDIPGFLDGVFQTIKASYEKGLEQFLDQSQSTRKIGFTG